MQYAIDYGNILNPHNQITLKSGIGTMFKIQYKNWKRGGGKGDVHTVTLIVQEWNVKVQCYHLSLGCANAIMNP